MNYNICRCIISELGFSKIVDFEFVVVVVFGLVNLCLVTEKTEGKLCSYVRARVFLGILNSMESNNSNSMRAVVVWMVLKLVDFFGPLGHKLKVLFEGW